MKTDKLPSRRQSVRENIEHFSKLTASQKIRLLEKTRRSIAYLRTLRGCEEDQSTPDVNR